MKNKKRMIEKSDETAFRKMREAGFSAKIRIRVCGRRKALSIRTLLEGRRCTTAQIITKYIKTHCLIDFR